MSVKVLEVARCEDWIFEGRTEVSRVLYLSVREREGSRTTLGFMT